jgi:sugar O-acyltransferase (sialic acid O-acetyltransferase NeuD family)
VRLVIVGAGGHGRETLDIVEAINAAAVGRGDEPPIELLGFAAEEADGARLARRGAVLLGPPAVVADLDADYVLGIGSSPARQALDAELSALGCHAATLIHPAASLGSDLRIGDGVLVAAGGRITTNVTIGRHSHVNVNAVVSHDSVIGDHVTLSPGVLVNGDCRIDDGAFLGTAAVLVRGRAVGAGAVIGAGAVVVSDVPPGVTAVGVPARWS